MNIIVFFSSLDSKVFCLGLIQSLFEGSMYTFVLEWTPAMTPSKCLDIHSNTAISFTVCLCPPLH